jgi:SAM-dependent methyltransferase
VPEPPLASVPLNPALRLRRRLALVMAPARLLIHRLSTHPTLWNLFRRLLEDNFRGEQAVIGRELIALTRQPPLVLLGRRPQVLDLGCGTGELAPIFLHAGYAYAGIDVEPARIAYARRAHRPGQFMVMDAGALGWPGATFDHILVTGVFHHLSDAEVTRILIEMRRVLRPGGRALVMEDTAVGFKLNLLGALVHLADEGSFIRQPDQYAALFAPHFRVQSHYRIRSGVCDYEVFVLVP